MLKYVAVSAAIIQNTAVGHFFPKAEEWTNRGQKLGLENRKKISQIINDYLYLLFSLLFILC
jgi:hypothetical protein